MIILIIIGVALILWSLLKSRIYFIAKKWNKTNGVFLEVSEGEFEEANLYATPSTFTYPEAIFEYSVGDNNYSNNTVTFEKRNFLKYKDDVNEFWNSWKAGETIDVFYNPSNPEESVLIPYMSKKRRSHYLAIVASGLLLIIMGFIVNSA